MSVPVLSYLIFIPVAGAILLTGFPRTREEEIRWGALGCSGLEAAVALLMLAGFKADATAGLMQYAESGPWIPMIGARFALGVDGLSVFLVVLSAILTPLAVLASWRSVHDRVREFHILLLLVEASTIGVFVSQDLLLFFVFWELMLIPMALLIGIWGGGRRIEASIKFVLYTMVGSLPMLGAVLTCGVLAGTFSLADLPAALDRAAQDGRFAPPLPWVCFAAFSLAFAIKIPIVPLHTWLPDAHVEAPTAGSVLLAGVLLKMGAYGFIRVALPCFPGALDAGLIGDLTVGALFRWIGVAGVLYGALMALAQTDMKKLVAYSSVSHLGFVVLGLFSLTVKGVEGATLLMISHGISTGGLFFLVGALYDRTHSRRIHDHGGLASAIPRYALVLLLTAFSSIGLPGLNGFPGELLVLLGAFEVSPWLAVAAAPGLVLGAIYLLGLVKRVLFGRPSNPHRLPPPDLDRRESVIFVILALGYFLMGLWPRLFVDRLEAAATQWVFVVQRVSPLSSGTAPDAGLNANEREY